MNRDKIYENALYAYKLLLAEETCKKQGDRVGELINKLEELQLTVAVVGQFKRGKSTLINTILKKPLMPVGIVPITSSLTKVIYEKNESGKAEVHFVNGRVEIVEIRRLSKYISEQENPENELGVASVIIGCDSGFLKNELELVDTPGVGSFHKNNTETAYHSIEACDVAIFLLSMDSPINEIEIDLLRRTKDFAAKLYFVVNKVDLVSREEQGQYLTYCKKILEHLMGGEMVKLYPVSARTGEGIEKLKEDVKVDGRQHAAEILASSTSLKLKDIVAETRSQLRLYWKAMSLMPREMVEKFRLLEIIVDRLIKEVKDRQGDYDVGLNEIKMELSREIEELFSMEYLYNIEVHGTKEESMTKKEFEEKALALLEELGSNMESILLYREKNTYKVARRIANLNLLIKRLKVMEDKLDAEELKV